MKKVFLLVLMSVFIRPVFAQEQNVVIDPEDFDFDMTEDAFGNELTPSLEQGSTTLNTKASLTENLKNNAAAEEGKSGSEESTETQNWVKSLFKGGGKNSSNVKELIGSTQVNVQKKRSNASVFDVSGVMLRMSYAQAEAELQKRGYRKTSQKMDVPNFIRWRNEEKCRGQGVVGYERIENCIIKLAQKGNYYYISEAFFSKFDSKETVKIFLSSTFTNNKVYKIIYQTEAANVSGNSIKAVYLRNLKVYDFWKKINQKYGRPDDEKEVFWGLGGNKPFLKASTGYLKLEDPLLQSLDTNRMAREDQRFIYSENYTF